MSGSGQETLPDVPEGWEALPDVRQLSGGLPGCLGGLADVQKCAEDPSGSSGGFGSPSQMSRSGRKSLPNVQEALPEVREALLDVREWLVGPPGCPGVVKRLSRMFKSGQEALPDVREWSGDPPGCLGEVGRPFVCP